jgi:hypothetical protein
MTFETPEKGSAKRLEVDRLKGIEAAKKRAESL